MTEKRFHFGYVLGDTGLIDEQAELKWFIENCCNVSDLKKNWIIVCDKLNELSEENEQLKKELHKIKSVNELLSMDLKESEHELWKENEQLKSELRNLRKLTNEIYMEGSE